MSGNQAWIRVLDEETAPPAFADPEQFRGTGTVVGVTDRYASLTLRPFALVRLDSVDE